MCQSAILLFCEETLRKINAKDVEFSGKGRSTNFIARKRWLLWNKWVLQWSRKRRIFTSKPSMVRRWKLSLYAMSMSLVMVMRFISGYDWNDKPYSSRFCSVISLESRPLILVYLYARTETIQKQMVQYDIKLKGKYPGKYSTVDKEGPDKLLARKSCFVQN